MWLPVMTGASESSFPGRRAKMLPILSTPMVQPASVHHFTNRSRACLSRSVSASRRTPPFSVAPIFAKSIRLCQRRSLLMRMFVVIGAPCRLQERAARARGRARPAPAGSFCRLAHRIVRVLRPVQIRLARLDLHHGDALRNRADMHAQVTADAL